MTDQQKKLDVLCLGIFVADTLAKPISKMPKWRRLALVDQVELAVGGCANNTATVLARFGLRVGAIGKVGRDGFGDFVLRHLEAEKIDIRGMRRSKETNTSFTFVMIAPNGERCFFHYIGANGKLGYEDIDFSLIQQTKILHVAGSLVMPGLDGEPTAKLLKRARRMGIITALDTVWNSSLDAYATIRSSLKHLDYFLPSIDEARLISGKKSPADIARFLMDQGVKTVGLKMGAEGCYLRNAGLDLRIPAFKIKPVDTSGAGDAWIAGFLTGVSHGWDLERAGRFGCAVGALCAGAIGTTTGLRNMEQVLDFMERAEVLNTK
ncbi:MAG: carbohydrate kinase family protein [Candidatus Omnitrophota bacterium]